jgi:hypothetical protein
MDSSIGSPVAQTGPNFSTLSGPSNDVAIQIGGTKFKG